MPTILYPEIEGIPFENVTLRVVSSNKKYILVSAVNYYNGFDYDSYCTNYRKKIIKSKPKEKLDFIHVDILDGKIKHYENDKLVKTDSYDAISKKVNYTGKAFTNQNGKTNYISKNTIYKLVTEIGKNDSGTLEELNVFSHAYSNGPILTNTFQYLDAARTLLNPNDLDMRMKDIEDTIFDFSNFKAAFTSSGVVKIWGCNHSFGGNNLIKQLLKKSQYKPDGSTKDNVVFTFNDNEDYRGNKVSGFAFEPLRTKVKAGKFDMTMLQIRKLFSYYYCASYPGFLASFVDVKVQAALPATYANFTESQAQGDPSGIFRISHDTKMNTAFFEKYLNVKLGELKYGIYDLTTYNKLATLYNS